MVPALCFGLFWSAAAPGAGHQLPPQVLLDQLLLRTERLIEADELDAAVEAMDEASALAEEHKLELPADFRFEQGRTEFAVGLLGTAKESVTEYLAVVNREAESYLDAVGLLEDVDRILERRDAPECSPLPEGPACWMELTSHPGCFVWNRVPQATETATWTGECSAGFAQGPGAVTWTYRDGEQEEGRKPPIRPVAWRVRDPGHCGLGFRGAVPVREGTRALGRAICGRRGSGRAVRGR